MQICDVEASVVITGIMDGTYVGKDISPLVLRDCTQLKRLAKCHYVDELINKRMIEDLKYAT